MNVPLLKKNLTSIRYLDKEFLEDKNEQSV